LSNALPPPARHSLRRFLLLGILAPVLAMVGINTASLYQQALAAADTAYDRTLLASAKAIGELLEVTGTDGNPRLHSTVPTAHWKPSRPTTAAACSTG
jgi:two-component system sensor histidine kinase TctE